MNHMARQCHLYIKALRFVRPHPSPSSPSPRLLYTMDFDRRASKLCIQVDLFKKISVKQGVVMTKMHPSPRKPQKTAKNAPITLPESAQFSCQVTAQSMFHRIRMVTSRSSIVNQLWQTVVLASASSLEPRAGIRSQFLANPMTSSCVWQDLRVSLR